MSDFLAFATAHGLQIDRLYPADRVQRCATLDKPRGKNGAFFWDGLRGWVSDWAQGGDINWFEGGEKKAFTEDQRKAWAERRRATEQRQHEGWSRACMVAESILRECETKEHNYLHSKGFGDSMGLVDLSGALIIPMRNFQSNILQGAQRISWVPEERRYDKKMLPGMRAKGAVLRLGPQRVQETIFCEGYATGLSIEAATRQMRLNAAVMICFSDSNMAQVATGFTGKGYCFADNDKSGAGERAAKAAGLPYCMSDVEGFDANDLHKKSGLMPVCSLLLKARRM